jgi:hypothetical protein
MSLGALNGSQLVHEQVYECRVVVDIVFTLE